MSVLLYNCSISCSVQKTMKAAPRNIQSLCKKTSVHFLILGTLFAGVLLVYIVTNAKTKDCIAEKLDSDYRARHQEAVDRAAEREYSMRLSPQEHNAKADEGSKLPSVAGLDSSRGPYSPAAVNHAESDTTKMAGSESSLGGRAKKGNVIIVGSSRRASSLAAVHDEIIGSTRLTGAGLEQPKELPLVEFCASDEKKKRFFTKENKRVTVSELAKSVVNSVEKYVFFVGYPRSGHSIIGSLLDSHPNMVISNEFGMFRKLIEEPNYQQVNRSFLYNALYRSSVCSYYFGLRAEEATKKGYTLRVDDAWQARYNGTIAVIGEKSGGNTGMTYRKYGHDKFLETFQRLLSTVKVPIFTIHAVRNPYDNIATMALMSKQSAVSKLDLTSEDPYQNQELLDWAIDNYFSRVKTVNEILMKLDLNIIEIHSKDLILHPKQTFAQICAILEVSCDDQFLDIVASKVFPEISKTRVLIVWSPEQKAQVAEEMKKYEFLHQYTFDN